MALDPKSATYRIPQLGDVVRITNVDHSRLLYGVVLHFHRSDNTQQAVSVDKAQVVQLLCNEQSHPIFLDLSVNPMRVVGNLRTSLYNELVDSMVEHRLGHPESKFMAHMRDKLQELVDKEEGQ